MFIDMREAYYRTSGGIGHNPGNVNYKLDRQVHALYLKTGSLF
jgi:hypothetical protein